MGTEMMGLSINEENKNYGAYEENTSTPSRALHCKKTIYKLEKYLCISNIY